MSIARYRHFVQNFELQKLFIDLGWDRHRARKSVEVSGVRYELTAFAEKRGVQIFQCGPSPDGKLPDYATRRKIEKQVTKIAYEYLIIFVDLDRTTQVWQWVSRRPGQPDRPREYTYRKGQTGDVIVEKLLGIEFKLSEEESIDLKTVTHRLRDRFDRDKVTKKFYERFKREHGAFLGFIEGTRRWWRIASGTPR